MSENNTSSRVGFIRNAVEEVTLMGQKLSLHIEAAREAIEKINVSSGFKIYNMLVDVKATHDQNKANVCKVSAEILEVYKKNKYNVGTYEELIDKALGVIADANTPIIDLAKMSLEANGEEDMAASNVLALNYALTDIAKGVKSSLLEISHHAKGLKADSDSQIAMQLGSSLEQNTNSIIELMAKVGDAVSEMAAMYKVELSSIADLSTGFNKIEEVQGDGNIEM